MKAAYLLHPAGLAALADFVTPETLFAFDLDGTLAPIVAEYSAVAIDQPIRTALCHLDQVAKLAIITGRSRQDALNILGFEPHLLIGNHGAEWPPGTGYDSRPFEQSAIVWQERLQTELFGVQGIEIEFKGASVSVHYRKAVDQEQALDRLDAVITKLSPTPKRISGKCVVNLLPMEAMTKGEALLAAMAMLGLARALFVGDDVTDEEVFVLRNCTILGIHIGRDNQTAATYYLEEQNEILGLLRAISSMLEQSGATRVVGQ